MKTTKLFIAIGAIILNAGFILAQNQTNKKDFTENLANNMYKSISRDVVLTDSQRVVFQTIAKEYEVKMKNLKGQAKSEAKKEKNKEAVLSYRAKFNQLLTKEQLDTLQSKRIQRMIENATKTTKK